MRPVGELVKRRLEEIGQSEAWLERQLGLKHRGDVNKVISGRRGLPRKSVEAWCAALGLEGAAADEFRFAAHLRRTDPTIVEAFDRLVVERDAARSLVTDYATRVAIIRRLVNDLGALHESALPDPPSAPGASPDTRA